MDLRKLKTLIDLVSESNVAELEIKLQPGATPRPRSDRPDLRTMANLEQVVVTFTFGRDAVWDFRGPRPSVSVSHSVRFTVHPRPGRSEEAGRAFFDRLFENVDERMGTL